MREISPRFSPCGGGGGRRYLWLQIRARGVEGATPGMLSPPVVQLVVCVGTVI